MGTYGILLCVVDYDEETKGKSRKDEEVILGVFSKDELSGLFSAQKKT